MSILRAPLAIAVLCVSAYVLLFPVASGSHSQTASCGQSSGQTVAEDSAARVYRIPTGIDSGDTLYDFYGCTSGSAKSRLLARRALTGVRVYGCVAIPCRLVRAIHVAGAKVGMIIDVHGVDTVNGTLTVRDLADGRVLHASHTYWQVPGYGDRLISYVLARSGDVAWATETRWSSSRTYWTIHRAIGHKQTTLDRGPKLRPRSLRLRGAQIEWIDGRRHRTARLP